MDGDGRARLRRAVQVGVRSLVIPFWLMGPCDTRLIIHHREDIGCVVSGAVRDAADSGCPPRQWATTEKLLAVCLCRRKGRNKVTAAVSGGALITSPLLLVMTIFAARSAVPVTWVPTGLMAHGQRPVAWYRR